jgi:transcriptional regulator with XRE-family HTH domain
MTPKEVRSRRLALGMSVDELARALGLPATTVRDIENGEHPMTSPALFDQTFKRLERTEADDGVR